jgi:hypothetical protein
LTVVLMHRAWVYQVCEDDSISDLQFRKTTEIRNPKSEIDPPLSMPS